MPSGRGAGRLTVLALLTVAMRAFAADAPVLSAEAAAALLRRSPDFAGRTARTFMDVRVIDVSDAEPKQGWVVEVRWQENGTPVLGRAVVFAGKAVAESAHPPREKLFYSADGWTLPYHLVTGQAADELLTGLQRVRRSANEMMAKADIRSIHSAQYAFAMDNDGHYGSLACLTAPRDCNLAYSGREYVSAKVASLGGRQGYRRMFQLGPAAAGYVYTAVPLEPGVTGVRGFCGDHTGRVCFTADGSEPDTKGGSCPASCTTEE
jgi:hypothetical protein